MVETPRAWVVIYHPAWQDEVHPRRWFHRLYAVYRAARYGLPLCDVEYIQVELNRVTGRIERARCETGPQPS